MAYSVYYYMIQVAHLHIKSTDTKKYCESDRYDMYIIIFKQPYITYLWTHQVIQLLINIVYT